MVPQALPPTGFRDYFDSAASLAAPPDTLGLGSRNSIFEGEGRARPFKGLTSLGANTGSRVSFTVKQGWGGLKDDGITQGAGSLFSYIGNSLFYIGAGQVHLNGVNISGALASSTLRILLSRAGSYTAVDSGPYDAGLAQPSAPTVRALTALGAGVSAITGVVSAKIARLRSQTGARSIASATSATISLTNQSFGLTFPSAATGQDKWALFLPQIGFGGVGVHYRYLPDISEATVAASSAGGVARTVEIGYQTGDLTPEAAWIQDYAPPAGTHAFALENIVGVAGCYADATNSPTSTNPGTAIAISLPNFPESYDPRHLLYLPESVVGLLGRPSDSYLFVGMLNSVAAVQYTGAIDRPACAVTMLWPDAGIEKPHNWCQAFGQIFAFVANGGAVTQGADGLPDNKFAAPVRWLMKDWTPASTIVGFDPSTLSVVYMNGGCSISFSLQSMKWSTPCYFSDFAAGSALSCVTYGGRLRVTLNNAGAHTAYSYDTGASSTTVVSITNWKGAMGAPLAIHNLDLALEVDSVAKPVYVSLHRNLRRTHATDCSITSGNNRLTSTAEAKWKQSDVGSYVLVLGAGAAGAPLLARIGTVLSATQVDLVVAAGDFATAAAQNASTTVAAAFSLIAKRIRGRTLTDTGEQHLKTFRNLNIRDCSSYALGVVLVTAATAGAAIAASPHVTPRGRKVTVAT